ncbi:hypothetical protein BMS3Abin07_02363 [bacterium BMS3Abin07]|nr:hypothetical protein BMS3Abin07_02363 [bacterium BMS3Abin07]GBE31388.1 hypothetical protein BMS3Bbin05_00288 [bacterium BMS3Bbin05]HDL21268.1 hypothetical protein [Nitrospirota bacterium]HDO21349.1 hypothetical protein [Nitrospirota bacterium]
MESPGMEKIRPFVRERLEPFIDDLTRGYENIHSYHVVGSAVTGDFVEGVSDINSVAVLTSMDLSFLDRVAPLGKKYQKKKIAAPLIMTPEYVTNSLDVFPVEFLNFKLIHQTIFGPDIFSEIEVGRKNLRIQCEREIKSKLIWLRQHYISSMGDSRLLLDNMTGLISGFMPLFRSIIWLMDREPPRETGQITDTLCSIFNFKANIFEKILDIKHKRYKPSKQEISEIFREYYRASEKIGRAVNDLQV